jgi:hypothetical protein
MISRDEKHIGEFVIQNEQNAESSEECENGSNTVYCVQDVNLEEFIQVEYMSYYSRSHLKTTTIIIIINLPELCGCKKCSP